LIDKAYNEAKREEKLVHNIAMDSC